MANNDMMKNNNNGRTSFNPMTIFDLFNRPISDFDLFNTKDIVDNLQVDIKEFSDHFEVVADLVGVKKEDIKLDYEDGVLTISASHHVDTNKNEEGYILQERQEGEYTRSFVIEDIDEDAISATFDNSVLTITLPKKQVKSKKAIEVK